MLARGCLRLLEWPYTATVQVRNWRYDTGRAAISKVEVPVVSVGNITLGGTGKTPAVEWLVRWFTERGLRVALVSRGYGAAAGEAVAFGATALCAAAQPPRDERPRPMARAAMGFRANLMGSFLHAGGRRSHAGCWPPASGS